MKRGLFWIGVSGLCLSLAAFRCEAALEVEWHGGGDPAIGFVKDLPQEREQWAPTFREMPTKAVVYVPSPPLGRDLAAASPEASIPIFWRLYRAFPPELRLWLQRLGVIEERGAQYKFLLPLRIVYSFHQLPSLPAQVSLASVDAKLPKPYALLCRPVENLEQMRCVCPCDEDKGAIHSCRFPNGYLLRSKTDNVAGDPFYRFALSGPTGTASSFYFLFLAPDARSKSLSLSLSFHILWHGGSAIVPRNALQYYLQSDQKLESIPATAASPSDPASPGPESQPDAPPPLDRDTLYRDIGIGDALAFHQKLFHEIFTKAAYNPDLEALLDSCCFGSLLDLGRLLPILRNLPISLLFITDRNTRARYKGSLRVSLTEEGVVPVIDVNALQGENSRLDQGTLAIVVRDAGSYNAFAKALWQHVRSVIVSDREASPGVYSINEARDVLCVLDEDVPAGKRLLDAVALLDKPEFKCTEWKILSASAHAGASGYLGLQLFILPETDTQRRS